MKSCLDKGRQAPAAEVGARSAEQTYKGLLSAGVSNAQMDIGGDGCVETQEVFEYLFSNAARFKDLVKTLTGRWPSWTINDFDPSTDFDVKIRGKINAAISVLKEIIEAKGVEKGSTEFKKLLSVGLFYFADFPEEIQIRTFQVFGGNALNDRARELDRLGLSEFKRYILRKGGLGLGVMASDSSEEVSAVEALRTRNANCSERSKILYAIFSMAGLKSNFVIADNQELVELFKVLYPGITPPDGHIFIGIKIGEKMRYFDPTLFNSNLEIKRPWILQAHHFAAAEIVNRAVERKKHRDLGEARRLLELALEISPKDGYAWFVYGNLHRDLAGQDGFVRSAELMIAEAAYRKSIEYEPNFSRVHESLGYVLKMRGEFGESARELLKARRLGPR